MSCHTMSCRQPRVWHGWAVAWDLVKREIGLNTVCWCVHCIVNILFLDFDSLMALNFALMALINPSPNHRRPTCWLAGLLADRASAGGIDDTQLRLVSECFECAVYQICMKKSIVSMTEVQLTTGDCCELPIIKGKSHVTKNVYRNRVRQKVVLKK